MSAQARTAAAGEAMTVLRADAPTASWLRALQSRYTQAYQPFADLTVRAEGTVDDFIPGRGPGERTNEA